MNLLLIKNVNTEILFLDTQFIAIVKMKIHQENAEERGTQVAKLKTKIVNFMNLIQLKMKILSNKKWKQFNDFCDDIALQNFQRKNELFKKEAKINTLIRENNELKRQINELKK
jgi:hypothetical protein